MFSFGALPPNCLFLCRESSVRLATIFLNMQLRKRQKINAFFLFGKEYHLALHCCASLVGLLWPTQPPPPPPQSISTRQPPTCLNVVDHHHSKFFNLTTLPPSSLYYRELISIVPHSRFSALIVVFLFSNLFIYFQ